MLDLFAGIFQGQEPTVRRAVGVQTFIAKTPVERLNKRVISGRRAVGLPGREKSSVTPVIIRPQIKRF